jgi:endonuclease/exonuclease/phosphatase (EEP) superfamily protein YafD
MKTGLLALGVLLILATAAPFVRSEEWWVRALGFPRLEIAILLALALVAFLFVYRPARTVDNIFLVALTASLGYQAYRIVPYTPLWTPEVVKSASCEESSRLRVLTANVLMDNRRAGDFLSLVWTHEPDLILAVETDQWWDERLSVLDGDYPFAVKHPRDNTYGLHLFSKLELGAPEVRFLIEDYVPSVRTGVRLRSGDWIDFYGVHPRPPKPQQDTEERDAEILIVGKEVRAGDRPAIVAGDLNDVAWSHTTRLFQRISRVITSSFVPAPSRISPLAVAPPEIWVDAVVVAPVLKDKLTWSVPDSGAVPSAQAAASKGARMSAEYERSML